MFRFRAGLTSPTWMGSSSSTATPSGRTQHLTDVRPRRHTSQRRLFSPNCARHLMSAARQFGGTSKCIRRGYMLISIILGYLLSGELFAHEDLCLIPSPPPLSTLHTRSEWANASDIQVKAAVAFMRCSLHRKSRVLELTDLARSESAFVMAAIISHKIGDIKKAKEYLSIAYSTHKNLKEQGALPSQVEEIMSDELPLIKDAQRGDWPIL